MFNPGMANMQGMMKKVQKMQQDMLKMQEELKTALLKQLPAAVLLPLL